ncbi:anaerobic ribonucleoside-triphosphate reductase-activating protein [Clostridium tetani]|uniref:Anaerobic ribonucleoside-triphosphate reductase-activating protein n=1 Tax=Clostridium tetani (strain Massachusetts / E88) TaxID=212717 RepID=Q899C6_CLOTE|nr:anaerobic ribonucleoside-triphosphate reductase activating protein [Clostridium tetani]AAO34903.1 anaerobic ribonucleoside-triphosphate reductase activating protein [Clostridium tetani E88]AVP55439.1 anaerobic ribonucleoside-triphosphate reductase activating protein [Clostridium tetani]KGI36423.1 ribonucleoside-triphosphate reductase activating protein [Clostridium tetani]KGI37278.1 ribonucleoside-triphosphate reductase activating protein [Clostridium tetani ATCC 9441]KGI44630.1 ribonucleos
MNYLQVAGFLDNSLANGKGLRSVLFLSGCNHKCKGCHNLIMQDFKYGDRVKIDEIMDRVKGNIPIIRGVTFSGGEPLEQAENLARLASMIKKENLNIWCYTGYEFEYILDNMNKINGWKNLIENIDILVDGTFQKDKNKPKLKYKGSSNQRIIDVQKSLIAKKIILYIV